MRRPRRALLIAGAGVLVAGAVATAVLGFRPAPPAGADPTPVDVDTATVNRGALVERVRVNGTLAFDGAEDLGTTLGGTITAVAPVGTVIGQGAELFRVDDKPVVLMLGTLPAWRPFEIGMEDGRDVLQLEQNLAALGFFDREPDEEFAGSTASAIEDWQEALGLEETGSIEAGRIVFAPTALRVAEHKAAPGDAVGAAVISASGTDKRVTAFVAPNLKSVVEVGAKVDVSLPDGTVAVGTVAAVGAPVEREDNTGGKSLKLPVTITLDDPAAAESYSDVSVSLELSRTLSEDALLVPVLALLAQPGGGFAVEVKKGSKTSVVDVELGAFADGMVEVVSGKIAEGDFVVVGK